MFVTKPGDLLPIIAGGQLTLVTAVLVSNHHLWVKYGEIVYASGGQNYLLLAMDMAKVGGPVSVVNVCTSMRCAKIGYRQVGGPLSVVKVCTSMLCAKIWYR